MCLVETGKCGEFDVLLKQSFLCLLAEVVGPKHKNLGTPGLEQRLHRILVSTMLRLLVDPALLVLIKTIEAQFALVYNARLVYLVKLGRQMAPEVTDEAVQLMKPEVSALLEREARFDEVGVYLGGDSVGRGVACESKQV